MKAKSGIQIEGPRTIDIENIHSNVTPEILEISVDKLKIVLLEHEHCIESSREWQTPLALLLTIALVLCTADFKEFIAVPASTWRAVFLIATGISFLWLVRTLYNKARRLTVDQLIERMKERT